MTDREELVRQAAELVPVLLEQAPEVENQRCIPQETVNRLIAAGFLRAIHPIRFGGMGLDCDVALDIAAELGRGCGSTAWCYSVWVSHNWLVGAFPEQAQEEYWHPSPDAISSSSLNPYCGTVTATSGGYQVSGRWDFCSGCDAASWVLIGGIGPEGRMMMMLPKSDYQIDDTWYASGLRGTGSKDVLVDQAFVPEHRTVLMTDLMEAQAPGRKVHDMANYRIPLRSILSFYLSAPIIGAAQGAIDSFEEYLGHRVSARTGQSMAHIAGIQTRLAEAEAEVRVARLLMQADGREVVDLAKNHTMPTREERARYRRDQAYVVRLCVQAVNRIYEASGGHAVFDSSPIQRFHRDVHAGAHHVSLFWDEVAEQYGMMRLGLEPPNPNL